ncbi:hypothetical protein [Pyruvatibacter mobilis]|uniref:hypothetical protein n=1 Tax=Pyruvatibacter mobilis TaxID=1712261 RepID=UPI003C7C9C4E
MTQLFKITDGRLEKASRAQLERETLIEDWVAGDLGLVGLDAIIIGRQVRMAHDQRIDLLALNEVGDLIVIELKRDQTPREVVAQVLDYASWISDLTTQDIHRLTRDHNDTSLTELYRQRFDKSLPDTLNTAHQMLIVAGSFDEASERIVKYLSEVHDVGINASFFSVFEQGGQRWLTTDFLLDQDDVTDRAVKKVRGPWTGFYYITGGTEEDRSWEVMRQHGFFSAHGGRQYTDKLGNLSLGDQVFYYQKGNGYLGYGLVSDEKTLATEFWLPDGRKLVEVVDEYYLTEHADDPDRAAYVVGVDWKCAFPVDQAQTFPGIFANQNVVCKIYQQETADFLARQFGVEAEGPKS